MVTKQAHALRRDEAKYSVAQLTNQYCIENRLTTALSFHCYLIDNDTRDGLRAGPVPTAQALRLRHQMLHQDHGCTSMR